MSFLKTLEAKYQVVADDQEDKEEMHETTEEDEPQDDDAYLSPTGPLGSRTSLSAGGKFLGEYKSDEEAEKALVDWIKKEKWHPNIWGVSDHGNVHPYSLSEESNKKLNS